METQCHVKLSYKSGHLAAQGWKQARPHFGTLKFKDSGLVQTHTHTRTHTHTFTCVYIYIHMYDSGLPATSAISKLPIPKSQVRGEQAFLRAALGRTRPSAQRPRHATYRPNFRVTLWIRHHQQWVQNGIVGFAPSTVGIILVIIYNYIIYIYI